VLRFDNLLSAVALFDRAAARPTLNHEVGLIDHPELGAALARYDIGLDELS